MNASFLATIAFAITAMSMIFLANLIGFMATGDGVYVAGLVLAMLAAGGSYLGQSRFTAAEKWLAIHSRQVDPSYHGPENPDAFRNHESEQRAGTIMQWACIAFAGAAALCFVAGGM